MPLLGASLLLHILMSRGIPWGEGPMQHYFALDPAASKASSAVSECGGSTLCCQIRPRAPIVQHLVFNHQMLRV